ncbi:hypothetical protein PCANC_01147 [Puccinia coronata f. sp. avenae]|uniref:Uncharacterized protein n=1 Tax=Puccinia coronata f. sp. avenae TaxID=200324 RepID=A0A2N5W5Y7_9BASI|nr:hypothetical protein PCASD_07995 [Puccinia coronata f. sp. avenae]PLW57656.1 hypothetical protein PCANC_01147 [Puccinia coronata f. sp. avenae]
MSAEQQQPPFNIALGISIGLVASFIQSLGLTIQRKSHLQNERLPLPLRKPDYARPVWLLGFTIYFSFNILGSIFQIGTLPLIILGPLGAISLLWNAILARCLLADRFSPHLILGTILIALGALLIALYGLLPDQSTSHDLDRLVYLYSRTPFIVEMLILILTFSVVCSFAHIYEFRLNQSLETISLLTISPTSSPHLINAHHSMDRDQEEQDQLLSRNPLENQSRNSHDTKKSPRKKQQDHHYPAYRPRSLSSPTHHHHHQTHSQHPLSLSFPHQPIAIIDSHIPLTPPFTNHSSCYQTKSSHPRLSRTFQRSNSHYSSSGSVQLPMDKDHDDDASSHGLMSSQKIHRLKLLIGIAYGSTSGTLSGICLLFAKTGVELLIRSLTGTVNEFYKIQTWLILFVLLISALLQLWYLNKALRLVNPTLICPLAFCFYNLSSIISGLVYYDQVKLLSTFQVFAISLGTIILLGGVWVVSIGTSSNNASSHQSASAEEEGGDERGGLQVKNDAGSSHGSAVDEDEETPLLPSSSRIGSVEEEEDGDEEHEQEQPVYTEDPREMDESYGLEEPPEGRASDLHRYSHQHTASSGSSSHPSSRRTSHPFDQLIRQFLVEGEVTPVRGFSIGLGAASPGFAIRPKKRRKPQANLASTSLTYPRNHAVGQSYHNYQPPSEEQQQQQQQEPPHSEPDDGCRLIHTDPH